MGNRPIVYSQMNLKDFLDCQKRFELAHLLHQAWPAVQSEPILAQERQMRLGQAFHLLAQQFFSGIPIAEIERQIFEPALEDYWRAFVEFAEPYRNVAHQTELKISGMVAGRQCVAVLDLVLRQPNKVIIIDWKTNQKKPTRDQLMKSIQSKLYPILTLEAYDLADHPDQVEMIYWFTNQPNDPEIIQYSLTQYHQDLLYLNELFAEIEQATEMGFSKTSFHSRCKYCRYRSFCERGEAASILDDETLQNWTEEINIEDIMQIGEIAF